jgi:hypothetical protein
MAILCLAIGQTGNQLVGWRDEKQKKCVCFENSKAK